MWSGVRGALIGLWLASAALAQPPCATCKGRGVVDCTRCDLELERSVERCSVAAACPQCGGTLVTPCPTCRDAAALAGLEAKGKLVASWLEARRQALLASTGGREIGLRAVMTCRSAAVDLAFGPGRIRGGPSPDAHRQMHLTVTRLEAARRAFLEVLGLTPHDFPVPAAAAETVAAPRDGSTRDLPSSRLHVFVLRDEDLYRRVCRIETGLVAQGIGAKRLGPRMVYVLRHVDDLADDAALHRNLVHNAIHLLLSHVSPQRWIGDEGQGWLDAGLAHFFEARLVEGLCTSLCFHEHAQPPLMVRQGRWRDAARDLRSKGALPAVRDLLGRDASALTPEEHVASFALVSALIDAQGGKAVGELVRQAKRERVPVDAAAAQTTLERWLDGEESKR